MTFLYNMFEKFWTHLWIDKVNGVILICLFFILEILIQSTICDYYRWKHNKRYGN